MQAVRVDREARERARTVYSACRMQEGEATERKQGRNRWKGKPGSERGVCGATGLGGVCIRRAGLAINQPVKKQPIRAHPRPMEARATTKKSSREMVEGVMAIASG